MRLGEAKCDNRNGAASDETRGHTGRDSDRCRAVGLWPDPRGRGPTAGYHRRESRPVGGSDATRNRRVRPGPAARANAGAHTGLSGVLRRSAAPKTEVTAAPQVPTGLETTVQPAVAVTEAPEPSPDLAETKIAASAAPPESAPDPARRPRLFGFLRNRTAAEPPAPSAAPVPESGAESPPEPLAESVQSPERAEPPRPRRGFALFGGPRRAASAPADPNGLSAAGPVPFGEVIQVCGLKRRDLGTEVARSPGPGSFRIYDTDPSSTQPRTQFLTGFKDNCARQFTASLVLFGSPAVHEATRYDAQNSSVYSATDTAYEKVKNRVCGVRRGQPCPESRAERLAREAAFLTVYRGFGDSGPWMEVFLNKGQLVAYQTQSR